MPPNKRQDKPSSEDRGALPLGAPLPLRRVLVQPLDEPLLVLVRQVRHAVVQEVKTAARCYKGTSVNRAPVENLTEWGRVSTHEHICQHQPPSPAPAAQQPCARCCSSGTRAGCRACASTALHRPGPLPRPGRGARCASRMTSCATRGRPR